MHSTRSRTLSTRPWAVLATALAMATLCALSPTPAQGQLGPRTLGNSAMNLDAGALGDELSITSSDTQTQKMDILRELSYLEPEEWQQSAVTWLSFRREADGGIVISEQGAGIVRGLKASKKWNLEPLEGGGWKATPAKSGGKMDLYLETQFQGEPFSVAAVVPKVDDEAYGAVYRGTDFLFFVVQKKHPEASAG